jgi:hypothetical protein
MPGPPVNQSLALFSFQHFALEQVEAQPHRWQGACVKLAA